MLYGIYEVVDEDILPFLVDIDRDKQLAEVRTFRVLWTPF